MRDYPFFIDPRFVAGSTVEGKVLALLNSLNTVAELTSIPDRHRAGYAQEGRGYGIRIDVAQNILDARPAEGFTSLSQIATLVRRRNTPEYYDYQIEGLGLDTFSDIVLAAIAASPGTDHRTITGNFRMINPAAAGLADATIPLDRDYDVIAFGKFQGSSSSAIFPVQIATQDDEGNFTLTHITNDFEEFALVGIFRKEGEEEDLSQFDLFHRSGLIPIQSFPLNELIYRPILINQTEAVTASSFQDDIKEQEGSETEDGEIIESLNSEFKEGLIEIKGRIRKEDTVLWFDSTVDFTSELFLYPTFYTSDWVRDLNKTVLTTSRITDQNHSNSGFWILTALSFLVPGIGGLLGIGLGIAFLVIDNNEDASEETKALLAAELENSLTTELITQFAEVIRDGVENASDLERLGLAFLASFEEAPADPFEAIIQFMIGHKTVRAITVDPDNLTIDAWLTLPFFVES
ncbi:hypothetical protein [Ascidiimonas sp. W6]|uniref:hypothetical protein n=1 Tax=Ascidiimonas meishanensis TaxID=3128903 RepID=UPI0030EB39F7